MNIIINNIVDAIVVVIIIIVVVTKEYNWNEWNKGNETYVWLVAKSIIFNG